MRDNFAAVLEKVLEHEGGWSDHPADPGGATMKGITLARYRTWKPGASKADLRQIDDDTLLSIYRKDYWDPVRADELPVGIDATVMDGSVNSGPGQSAKWLQREVGVAADGEVGPVTVAAANAAPSKVAVIRGYTRRRLAMLMGLPHWNTFKKGWSRRVADVEAFSVALAQFASGASAAEVEAEATAAGKAADAASRRNTAGGSVSGGAGATGATTIATNGSATVPEVTAPDGAPIPHWHPMDGGQAAAGIDLTDLAIGAGIVIAVAVAVILFVRAAQQRARSAASGAVAAEVAGAIAR